MRREPICVICDGKPVVGFLGLCKPCSEALTRWMDGRRQRLRLRRRGGH